MSLFIKIITVTPLLILFASGAGGQISPNLPLTDIRCIYVYEYSYDIDWALIMHLTLEEGCRVHLVSVRSGTIFREITNSAEKYNLSSSLFYMPSDSRASRDSIEAILLDGYLPDFVVFSGQFESPELNALEDAFLNTTCDSSRIFCIKKRFRRTREISIGSIYINLRQYLGKYQKEIGEISGALGMDRPPVDPDMVYSIYDCVERDASDSSRTPSFLTGIAPFKLDCLISNYITDSVVLTDLENRYENYISYLSGISNRARPEDYECLFAAVGEYQAIRQTFSLQAGEVFVLPGVKRYFEDACSSLVGAFLRLAGLECHSEATVRDTPEGRRLKYKMEMSNEGNLAIEAGWLAFKPPWRSEPVIIDSSRIIILPGNCLIREYTIDIEPEGTDEVSKANMEFTYKVAYEGNELESRHQVNLFTPSLLTMEFSPDFYIIKSSAVLPVDHLVAPIKLKLLIDKPSESAADLRMNLEIPEGFEPGAYRDHIRLGRNEKGAEVEIPLAISERLDSGKYAIVARAQSDETAVALDTAYIGRLEYSFPENISVAVLADSTGLLEDILRAGGINYGILSDRYLKVGDLNVYDAIILGSNCLTGYKSIGEVSYRIKEYIEYGGRVVIFGQPDNWPDDLLFIPIVSTAARIHGKDLLIDAGDHPVFSVKYKLNPGNLIGNVDSTFISYPAIIFPGQKIIETDDKRALLLEADFGTGRLIYCGFPLLEMVRDLNPDAVRFFSNLVYYLRR
jgi:hypothetical protein